MFITKKWYLIPLLAFLLPLIVRIIPEVLVGPYIVGFDTMGFYAPNTLEWLYGGIDFWRYLAVAPLFYAFLMSLVSAGMSVIVALKVLSPLLLGLLGLSIYCYAHKGLGWSSLKSLAPALLGTIYFVALRISWDMLRTELGLIFLFIVLTLLTQIKGGSWKRCVVLSLAMVAVVLSHQLVAVIMLGVVVFTVVHDLFYKDFRKSVILLVTTFPAAVFALVVYFFAAVSVGFQDYTTSTELLLGGWLGFSSYPDMLLSEVGFFLFCFLPLLPLVVFGFKRLCDFQLRCWLVLSLFLLLLPFAFVSPYRWLLLLVYPFAFFVVDAVSGLRVIRWKRFKITAQKIAIFYLVLSTVIFSFGYLFSPPERPFFYFSPQCINSYSYQIPTSMQQNTISVADFQGTINALRWFEENKKPGDLLLTHTVFYSWALLTLNDVAVVNYDFGDPVEAASIAKQDGYAQIFLVWWIDGEGWYAQSSLPSVFQEIYRSERIAIYFYD
ncbi:MAG: hypothetical protein LBH74_08640 [Nitrososphaerota archaeon]|jgi:hypothetical protein|nr:hypothetical protein [Nitrososphaerota archaeon]